MRSLILGLLLASAPAAVLAQEANPNQVYQLGELQVTAHDRNGEALGGTVVSGDTLQAFDKQTVDEALDLIPGANASISGGSRNETLVYVRGFDRFETTLSVDGVRVFLPADNRIDFARFLTADLSEVQVSKGYVSVLDGPGALGGAINLVTIKPTKKLEGGLEATSYIDQDYNQEAYLFAARLGGRYDKVYWQVSGETTDRDYFTLSNNFVPTTLENGGPRNHSESNDWRVNAKVGFTPNDTDEYSLNYTKQEGVKDAPYSTTDTTNTKFWSWPYWNTSSLAFLSKTKLGDRLTLRSRLYYNGFDNLLSSFDDVNQTVQSQPKAFNSFYLDRATGGNLELDWDLNTTSQLKGVFYARRDIHDERQDGFVKVPPTGSPSAFAAYHEPWQQDDEYTYSLAGQYSTGLGERLDLTVGVSYDWTDLIAANDVNTVVTGTTIANSVISFSPVNYPLKNNNAVNGQAALVWRVNDDVRAHVSVSDRTRFPTVFERFSSRMGAAIPNPDVGPERAINYEVGADAKLGSGLTTSGAVFYSDVDDALLQIPVLVPTFGVVNQTKNVAKGRFYGFEVSADWKATDTLTLGGNFTYLRREFRDATGAPAATPPIPPGTEVVDPGVPNAKSFLYATWRPLPKLTIRPSFEIASSRYSVTSGAGFVKTGAYSLVNLSADYAITRNVTATLAAKNLDDRNYELTSGFPSEGRSFYASVRARF